MATATVAAETKHLLEPRQRFVMDNLDWANYRKINDAITERNVRITFDRGWLELMTKSTLHCALSRLYNYMVWILAAEFGHQLVSCGDMTFDREDLNRACEPDECMYLVNAALVKGKDQINLAVDPPPDLVVEVDLSSSSKRRLKIYAAIKVPEVWLADAESLTILRLGDDGEYVVAEESQYFPGIPVSEIAAFVQRRAEWDDVELLRQFTAWVQRQRTA